ncbi:Zn-ribbon domain-containing OB-fold protein [Roseomonas chloroacetimidivorans]|uniref:Zn-ribbon domain-containing OB-fold protein n=1 Tax=Roseomonas chloroacetimidivorans TaxID=1766656 RepID=UPI003C79006D
MSGEAQVPIPCPEPTEESRPYWHALAAGQLLLQHCAACGRIRHYPRPLCDACHSFDTDWIAASGRARVHSWTVAHHAFHPAFRGALPYLLITADLEEGVRILAQGRGPVGWEPAPEQPLRVGFEEAAPGLILPVLCPA